MLSVIIAECRFAECRYAECRYAECHYTESDYAECRGAKVHEWRHLLQAGVSVSYG